MRKKFEAAKARPMTMPEMDITQSGAPGLTLVAAAFAMLETSGRGQRLERG